MALPKIKEARELDNQALEEAIADTKRKLFDLRFQQATRQLQSGLHQFKHERHRLAQLMTVLRERQLSEAQAIDSTQTPSAAAISSAEEE
ncbi:MAG: 50S ribosomal protein L29 [Leptolyngbyaceae cyanobacterium]